MQRVVVFSVALALAACGAGSANKAGGAGSALELDVVGGWDDPVGDYPGARAPGGGANPLVNPDAPVIAIVGATVLTGTGNKIERGTVVLRGGSIAAIGAAGSVTVPQNAVVIDGAGKTVTPGIIDVHSHVGVYSEPNVDAHQDGNEMVAPSTPYARAAYAYNPQDPAIPRAVAGGVTAAQILPGSGNMIGGGSVTVAMVPGRVVEDVVFPAHKPGIKMACGENPKRAYGQKGGPMTRMGEYAVFRQLFQQAAEYRAKWTGYRRARKLWDDKRRRARQLEAAPAAKGKKVKPEPAPEMPPRDLGLATLAAVLSGELLVHVHCYKAVEMREMIAIADEFGFKIRAFHHALEAYKIRDILAEHDISVATWADWWGFKMEAFDGIQENMALIEEAGGRPLIHSDSSTGMQRLNQEVAKAMHAGRAAGIEITEEQALRWMTVNPAWALGIEEVTGTLEVGKRADVVVWTASPFSVYARPEVTIVGGQIAYRRSDGLKPTDFELGNSAIDQNRKTEGER